MHEQWLLLLCIFNAMHLIYKTDVKLITEWNYKIIMTCFGKLHKLLMELLVQCGGMLGSPLRSTKTVRCQPRDKYIMWPLKYMG